MPAKQPAKLPTPAKRKRRRRIHPGTIFIIVGVAAIAAAAAIWLYNEFDDKRASEVAEVRVQSILEIIRTYDPTSDEQGSVGAGAASDSASAGSAGSESQDMDAPAAGSSGGTSYVVVEREAYMGILTVPSLGLNLPVNLSWSYPKLRISPCRYSGDVEHNDLVIAAHSYRSHFGNINSLNIGDAVTFTDTHGREYRYYVAAQEIVPPASTRSVVTSPYDLTLFTCTFDSRSRVVVRCFREPEPEAPTEVAPVGGFGDTSSTEEQGADPVGEASEQPPQTTDAAQPQEPDLPYELPLDSSGDG